MRGGVKELLFSIVISVLAVSATHSQGTVVPNGTDGLELTKPPRDSIGPSGIKFDPAPQVNAPFTTFRLGAGLIYDLAAYRRNRTFDQQLDSLGVTMESAGKLRDFRILGSGVIRSKRPISWKFAFMWDGANDTWLIRETGVTVAVPELWGHFFIGRTKEGFSLVKVMNGHSPWTNERAMSIDPIPILADGIKWIGFEPTTRIFWNLGLFNDVLSEGQGFSTYSWQLVTRVGHLPIHDTENGRTLHVGANIRFGKPLDEKFSMRSRPESNPAPYLLTSGEFQAERSSHVGYEVYYTNKRLTIGSEALIHNFYSAEGDDHQFFGGEFLFSYFFTNSARPYKTDVSIYGFVPVRRSVFKGGTGEIEGILRVSTFNMNDGSVKGGQFWRITPMVNWYVSKVIRLEFIYGYGIFDRFNLQGNVQFFESRIQFTMM